MGVHVSLQDTDFSSFKTYLVGVLHSHFHALEKEPTPAFLPGESQGQQSLVGCRLWVTQSDATEAT